MNLPPVAIQICTFRRPTEIRRTINALITNLTYPSELLHWFICDDSSGGTYIDDLRATYNIPFNFVVTPQRGGWGVNVNNGLTHIFNMGFDYIYFTEDDYVLRHPLDFTKGITLMQHKPIGLIRYDGIAGHLGMQLELEELYIDGFPDGIQKGCINYFKILKSSLHLNVYSNRPHLKNAKFHGYYGMYPMGLPLGHTEIAYTHMVRDRMEDTYAPQIAVFPEWVSRWYDDIGVSYQLSEYDLETTK